MDPKDALELVRSQPIGTALTLTLPDPQMDGLHRSSVSTKVDSDCWVEWYTDRDGAPRVSTFGDLGVSLALITDTHIWNFS